MFDVVEADEARRLLDDVAAVEAPIDFVVPAARPVWAAGNSRGIRITKRAGI